MHKKEKTISIKTKKSKHVKLNGHSSPKDQLFWGSGAHLCSGKQNRILWQANIENMGKIGF